MNWKDKDAVNEYMREYKKTHNSDKKYYEAHKEEILKKQKEYAEKNNDKIKEYGSAYRSVNAEKLKEYRESKKDETKEYNRQYYLKNKEKLIASRKEYLKAYNETKMGRAQKQFQQYKRMDERNGFGKKYCDFDAKWIVEYIYTKPCTHCGETDWHKLGCNRLDNTKPHTKDNVESCCFHCNCVLNGIEAKSRSRR